MTATLHLRFAVTRLRSGLGQVEAVQGPKSDGGFAGRKRSSCCQVSGSSNDSITRHPVYGRGNALPGQGRCRTAPWRLSTSELEAEGVPGPCSMAHSASNTVPCAHRIQTGICPHSGLPQPHPGPAESGAKLILAFHTRTPRSSRSCHSGRRGGICVQQLSYALSNPALTEAGGFEAGKHLAAGVFRTELRGEALGIEEW